MAEYNCKCYLNIKYRYVKDFIYIKPQKTATKTIRTTLSEVIGNTQGMFIQNHKRIHRGHLTYQSYIKMFPETTTNNTIFFASTRNPWDRLVSWFHYSGEYNLNFTEWITDFLKKSPILKPVTRFICGCNDIKIIRFEHIQHDFNIICEEIGISPIVLLHLNRGERKPYREYYNDQTRKMVADSVFSEDIDYFKYTF